MENESSSPKRFVPRYLPWIIASAMLFIYLLTTRGWMTYSGLPHLVRTLGWDWHPTHVAPLYHLLSYPLRWLPGGLQILGANLFGLICAVLSLALLARSVALLPHDRTRDQRQFERSDDSLLTIPGAWIPPLLATLVCGLQLTFWENSVIASGEALDLLLFAYVIRCLLEYRLDQRESWLARLAFVHGLAMTNNAAMIAFLPALALALFWIKGLSLFNFRLCLKMVLCGLAGLSLYLVLPSIQTFGNPGDLSFLEALKLNVGFQKSLIFGFPRSRILLMGLTSLLPILFMGIKWPAQFGDISAVGNALTNLMTHLIHVVFFLACIYVAFDPPFSPRSLGYGYAFLPFYYLGALCIGYFTGYFLLVFNPRQAAKPGKSWERPSSLRKAVSYIMAAMVVIALIGVPAGLAYKNLPTIRAANSKDLTVYGRAVANSLPPAGVVVMSDDQIGLYALAAALTENNSRKNHILVDTKALSQPAYQRYLRKSYLQRWPASAVDYPLLDKIPDPVLLQLISDLSGSTEIYYLHPSFGYYFEQFYMVPRKMAYQLKPYPTNEVSTPQLSAEIIRENDDFWRSFEERELSALGKAQEQKKKKKLEPNTVSAFLTVSYSQRLNTFGVELQRSGELEKAGHYFGAALQVYPDNPAAFVNQDYNRILRSGQRESVKPSEGAVARLAPYSGDWNVLLSVNGPVDEPNSCFLLAEVLARGRNSRQAAYQLERVLFFNPENRQASIGLVSMYVQNRFMDKAIKLIAKIRAEATQRPLTDDEHLALLQSEAWIHAGQNETATAEKILRAAQEKYPQYSAPFSTLSEIYLVSGDITNAMGVLELQMKLQPENVSAKVNYGALKVKTSDFAKAIPLFDSVLKLQPQNTYALMNRALLYLKTGKLELAQSDFENLRKILPKPLYAVSYGLGEIAYQKKNRKDALENYKEYLKLAPPGTPEIAVVRDRVKALEHGRF